MSQNQALFRHIGIIPDGNRSWAAANNLTTAEGHQYGYSKIKEVLDWCRQIGLKTLTIYAFSTENWSRVPTEVKFLMQLLYRVLSSRSNLQEFKEKGVNVRIIGQKDHLSARLQKAIRHIENETRDNSQILLQVAFSYGGRAEIIDAIKRIAKQGFQSEQITEQMVSESLWTAGVPDPDMIIRTSGVMRLSNFLLWQSAYSELFFTPTLWPDFSRAEFDAIVAEFNQRKRRYGH